MLIEWKIMEDTVCWWDRTNIFVECWSETVQPVSGSFHLQNVNDGFRDIMILGANIWWLACYKMCHNCTSMSLRTVT